MTRSKLLIVGLILAAAVSGTVAAPAGQRVEAAPPGWSEPLNVSQNPVAQSEQPRIALTSDGSANVVWHNDQSEIFYASKASAAASFASPTNISCSTSGPSWTADMAADGNDDLHVVWTDQTTGDGDPYYQFKAVGGGWTCPPTNVHATSLFSPAQRVAADQSGNVHLAWSQAMGAASDIFYCYKPNAGSWSCQNLDEGISGFPHQASPAIAVDGAGAAHMAVNETVDGSTSAYRIMYRSRPFGGSWSSMTEVDFSPSGSFAPDIAVQADGTAHIVWSDTREASRQIYYTTNAGGGWSAPAPVASTAVDSERPTIAVDSSGVVHVAWDEGDIYYAKNAGSGWSGPVNVSQSTGDPASPAITTDASDNVHLVWHDNRTTDENPSGNYEVYYSSTVTPSPVLRIIFVQGISSQSSCDDSPDFLGTVGWIRDGLASADLEIGGFHYYSYSSLANIAAYCLNNTVAPAYEAADTCWSLDDRSGRRPLSSLVTANPNGDKGQGARLARYIRQLIALYPNDNFAIIAHSQGALLSTYVVTEAADLQQHVATILSLEGVLGGTNGLSARAVSDNAGCPESGMYDSPRDMMTGMPLPRAVGSARGVLTKLYTVGGTSSDLCLLPGGRLCIEFVNDVHSTLHWRTAHIRVEADHSTVWTGDFAEAGRLLSFIACAIGQVSNDCVAYADQP